MAKVKIGEILTQTGGVAVGAIAVKIGVEKVMPTAKPLIKGGLMIAAGGAALAFAPAKLKFVQALGNGAIAAGALELANNFMPGMMGGAPTEEAPTSGVGDADAEFTTDTAFDEYNIEGTGDDDGGVGTADDKGGMD